MATGASERGLDQLAAAVHRAAPYHPAVNPGQHTSLSLPSSASAIAAANAQRIADQTYANTLRTIANNAVRKVFPPAFSPTVAVAHPAQVKAKTAIQNAMDTGFMKNNPLKRILKNAGAR